MFIALFAVYFLLSLAGVPDRWSLTIITICGIITTIGQLIDKHHKRTFYRNAGKIAAKNVDK